MVNASLNAAFKLKFLNYNNNYIIIILLFTLQIKYLLKRTKKKQSILKSY